MIFFTTANETNKHPKLRIFVKELVLFQYCHMKNKLTNKAPLQAQGSTVALASTFLVFTVIAVIYLTTLLTLFPNLPVITVRAEDMPNYVEIYPPFRMDEFNYYTIARNIISGDIYREGSIERSFSIGFPLAAVPFVMVWDKLGCYLANTLIVWLSLIMFFLTIRRYVTRTIALLMTSLLAFATIEWFYAVSCYTEPLAQLFVISGFYFLTRTESSGRRRIMFFLAGAVSGLLLFVRAHFILIAVPFLLITWIKGRKPIRFDHRALWYAGGVLLVLALWLIRNQLFFGNPLTFEYSRMFGQLIGSQTSRYYDGNFFWGIHELLFDKFHGLFTIMPILLLFPVGLGRMWQKGLKYEMLLLLTSVLIIVLFIASSPYPFTQFGLGSRHMVPILPLIFLPSIFFINHTFSNRIVFTLLAAYSLYFAGLGWFTGSAEYIGELGFFTGLLQQRSSKSIILARKHLLPERHFKSKLELFQTFDDALKKSDYMMLFQTFNPQVIDDIKGNERRFVTFIRSQSNQDALISLIEKADPNEGILFNKIRFEK